MLEAATLITSRVSLQFNLVLHKNSSFEDVRIAFHDLTKKEGNFWSSLLITMKFVTLFMVASVFQGEKKVLFL